MIAVLTDSTSDLSPEAARHFGIHVIPLHVHMNGKTLLDWEEVDPDAVYTHMRQGGQATTSPASVEAFTETYTRLLQTHEAVVSIHISRKLSDTVLHARKAVEGLGEAGRIRVIDSLLAAPPLAEVAIAARQAALSGKDLDGIEAAVNRTRQDMYAEFSVASLEYLRRSGRIGKAAELLGNMLDLRPVLTFQQGEFKALRRVKTRQAASLMVEQLRQKYGKEPVIVTIAHAGRDVPRFTELRHAITQGGLKVRSGRTLLLGPVIGAHVGPGTFGVLARPYDGP